MQLVTAAAIDYDGGNDKYFVTVEVFNPQHMGSHDSGGLLYSTGESVFDCFRNLILRSGRRLYWGHTEIFIVSREVAERSLLPILDILFRDAEVRDDMLIFVAEEDNASDILRLGRHKLHGLAGFHIEDVIKAESSISKYRRMPAWKFIQSMYAQGPASTLPLIKLDRSGEKEIPKVGGTAVFEGDKLVGTLDETETRSLLWILDELKGGVFVVPVKDGGKAEEVTLEIFESKTDTKAVYAGNQVTMKIHVETTVNIEEIGGTTDYMDEKKMMHLKKDGEARIEKEIKNVIGKVQREFAADVFKFSTVIQDEMPKVWREIEPNWHETFKKLPVNVQVTLKIRGSALMGKPIKISR
ncbi:Spore germination protein B3 [Thermotalea metallivorans]|uniref:Spore germination protein B3 n=2 Tax=Thermotalea metallivorans TaxID=520762 RepID=A0A140L2G1_9FIRM|nr:Spore germination protein B3 [Thermotalea metallivorans]